MEIKEFDLMLKSDTKYIIYNGKNILPEDIKVYKIEDDYLIKIEKIFNIDSYYGETISDREKYQINYNNKISIIVKEFAFVEIDVFPEGYGISFDKDIKNWYVKVFDVEFNNFN